MKELTPVISSIIRNLAAAAFGSAWVTSHDSIIVPITAALGLAITAWFGARNAIRNRDEKEELKSQIPGPDSDHK